MPLSIVIEITVKFPLAVDVGSASTQYRGRHSFPPEIISHTGRLRHRFGLSLRVVWDLLTERGGPRVPAEPIAAAGA